MPLDKTKPHCTEQPCVMTAGYPIGGGAHICWLHILTMPATVQMFVFKMRMITLETYRNEEPSANSVSV